MKTIPIAVANHLATGDHTLATCLRVEREDGQVFGFTDHDKNLTVSGLTYYTVRSYTATDVQTSDQMNVDSLDLEGPSDETLATPGLTDDDVTAGLWDFAQFRLFRVNWASPSDGEIKMRKGRLGEISLGKGTWKEELRGMMQAYSRNLGRIYKPGCDATLGDSRCGVALNGSPSFTVSGTLDSVSDDLMTMFDSARNETGPSGGVGIASITQADPGVVTTSTNHGLIDGQSVIISGVSGMVEVNTVFVALNVTPTTFEISDTSDFAAASGGTVTPMSNGGYFDNGLMTITGGGPSPNPNIGISREVKGYVAGQWTLFLPFPYPLIGNEQYTMVAGCDKTLETCISKFNNATNFRGFPHLRGNDALVQVGRHG